jgi:hypothetical protein
VNVNLDPARNPWHRARGSHPARARAGDLVTKDPNLGLRGQWGETAFPRSGSGVAVGRRIGSWVWQLRLCRRVEAWPDYHGYSVRGAIRCDGSLTQHPETAPLLAAIVLEMRKPVLASAGVTEEPTSLQTASQTVSRSPRVPQRTLAHVQCDHHPRRRPELSAAAHFLASKAKATSDDVLALATTWERWVDGPRDDR